MRSIERRLAVGLFAGLSLLLSLCGVLLYGSTRIMLLGQFDAALTAVAQELASQVRVEDGRVDFDAPPGSGADYFQIWRADGTTFARSPSLGSAQLPQRYGPSDVPDIWDLRLPDGHAGRAIGLQARARCEEEDEEEELVAGAPVTVTLVVARSRGSVDDALRSLAAGILVVGGLILVATAALVKWVLRKGLAPLARIADHAATIDAATLDFRFPGAGQVPLELRPICARLNDLMGRLEEAFGRERRFTADVSHELRTPIAELRALAEVSLYGRPQTDAAVPMLHEVLDISLQMERVVTALLSLARCEAGQQQVLVESVDLGRLVEEIWVPMATAAQETRLQVSFALGRGVVVETDRTAMRSIVHNLLANAVEHAPIGGQLDAELADDGVGFRLAVTNTCTDLTASDLDQMFQPFWRKDEARTGAAHSGLGLAVAATLARLLEFDLRAERADGSLLRFVLSGAR